jgi:RNA polymerase sigma-70 factor (ECF subfamily)
VRLEPDPGGLVRSEDKARFAWLYIRCYPPIRDYCSRRLAVDAVDDAVADTFLTVWRRIDEVPDDDHALLWIYAVAYRVVGHQWRSTARRRRLHDRLRWATRHSSPGADESVLADDEFRVVRAALGRLDDAHAEVLRLVAWEHLSVADVAVVLGIGHDAARQRLHRARRRLASEYDRLQIRSMTKRVPPSEGAS